MGGSGGVSAFWDRDRNTAEDILLFEHWRTTVFAFRQVEGLRMRHKYSICRRIDVYLQDWEIEMTCPCFQRSGGASPRGAPSELYTTQ